MLADGAVGSAQLAPGALSTPITIAGTSQEAEANTSYAATGDSLTQFILPETAEEGDIVQISGAGAGGWQTFLFPNAGETWTARESNRGWRSVASSADGSKLVAVVSSGQIYTSTNSGVTWTPRETNRNWVAVASSADGSKLVAVVYGGQIYTSTDTGVTWTPRESNRNWLSVSSSGDGSKLVAVAYLDYIYTSTDSGVTWTPRESNRNWECVASSNDGSNLVAVAFLDHIYTSTDNGVTWTPREGNRQWDSVASSASGDRLVAMNYGGRIYTSTDTGVTWTPRESNRGWQHVASSADGNKLVAVVDGGQIYTSEAASVSGAPGTAQEFQYLGNGLWQPVGVLDTALSANVALLDRSPQTFTGENHFSSSTQLSERLRLSGQEFFQDGWTSTHGISLLMGVNRPDNRQLWIADSGRLAINDTNPMLRLWVEDVAKIDSLATDGMHLLPLSLGANRLMTLSPDGKVGIGTTTPSHTLTVVSDTATYDNPVVRVQSQNTGATGSSAIGFFDAAGTQKAWIGVNTGTGLGGGQGALQLYTESGQTITFGDDDLGADLVLDGSNDCVGIGTGFPTKAKVEISGSQATSLSYGFLNSSGGTGTASGSNGYSLYASDRIAAVEFNAFSDARIKDIQSTSDGAEDLQTLLGIEVTDYTYRDTIAKGDRPQKKVIAQQVEQVYPQAVSQSTDEVPDIYQQAVVEDGWVQLDTDLKVGERVKLIGEKQQGVYAVMEVRDGAFRTGFQPKGEKVFVYGREVDDFRTVDYEAIAMLNVSATQEIYRELTQLKGENAELRQKVSRLDELAQKNAAMESRLVALEKLITRQQLALNAGAR